MTDVLSLYPLFDSIDGGFLFHPIYPVPPYPIYVSLDQMRDYVGGFPAYTLVAPVSGQTLSVPSTDKYIMNPAAALTTLTLQLPIVLDKRNIRIASRQRIDALTVNGLGGMAVDWTAGDQLPQHGNIDFTFVSSLGRWVRA